MPPTVIELQEQWLELARFHIQRLRREIHQKEQMIANLQAENRMLLLRNAHDQEKKRTNLTVCHNSLNCRDIFKFSSFRMPITATNLHKDNERSGATKS